MISQIDWINREFNFNFPVEMFPVIMERLRGTVSHLEMLISGQSEELLVRKNNTNWSVKEEIGHLYDLEELWYGRVTDFLAGAEMLRAADITNVRTSKANHNEKEADQLIRQFAAARNNLVEKVISIDEATASLISVHPRLQKPMRLVDSLFFIAEHDDHHLAKIRNLLL